MHILSARRLASAALGLGLAIAAHPVGAAAWQGEGIGSVLAVSGGGYFLVQERHCTVLPERGSIVVLDSSPAYLVFFADKACFDGIDVYIATSHEVVSVPALAGSMIVLRTSGR